MPNRIDQIWRNRRPAPGGASSRAGVADEDFKDVELYDPVDTSMGGIHAMVIVRGDPKAYNSPPHPDVPTHYLRKGWKSAELQRA